MDKRREHPSNRQVMLHYEALNELNRKAITKETFCLKITKALECTLPLKAAMASGEKYMTNEEVLCIQNMASESEGPAAVKKRYIETLREMYRFYEESGMISSCINMYEVVMDYVASELGNMGEYDESDAISRAFITESLRLHRLYGIHQSIYNIMWNDGQRQREGILSESRRNPERDLQHCVVLSEFCKETRSREFYWKKLSKIKE